MKTSPLLRRLSFRLAGVLALATCQVAALTPVLPLAKNMPAIAIEAPPPRLVARDAQIPLRLDSVAINTSIAGRLAHTSVELTFFNPNARVLEGELQFPLADGQEITGMAMDFNGVMREAVPVAKARGQAVFEEVTRTRVDPALAEKTVGNNFKLRVYPIPAGGRKTVVLRYEESLTQRGADWIYRLPLAYGERVARFKWTGAIATSRAPRVLRTTAGEPELTPGAAGFDLNLARQDLQLTGAAEIAITPEGTAPAATQAFEGATYFYAEPAVRSAPAPRKAPTRVAIAWDASGSGTERDHAREFGLLSAYFKRFTDVVVMLTVFRDRAEPAQAWAPDSAYARRLRDAEAKDLYRIYLDERESHRNSTAFFLDVADLLLAKGERALAMRVLSNLAEMNLENRHILRVLGYRLLQAGEATAALPVFRRVRDLSPNEPQSHRDLGLAYAQAGQAQKAVDSFYEVVSRPWHGRFPEVELIALAELNAVVANSTRSLDTSRIDPRLLRNLPLDLRAVLTWDADNTDIDSGSRIRTARRPSTGIA